MTKLLACSLTELTLPHFIRPWTSICLFYWLARVYPKRILGALLQSCKKRLKEVIILRNSNRARKTVDNLSIMYARLRVPLPNCWGNWRFAPHRMRAVTSYYGPPPSAYIAPRRAKYLRVRKRTKLGGWGPGDACHCYNVPLQDRGSRLPINKMS